MESSFAIQISHILREVARVARISPRRLRRREGHKKARDPTGSMGLCSGVWDAGGGEPEAPNLHGECRGEEKVQVMWIQSCVTGKGPTVMQCTWPGTSATFCDGRTFSICEQARIFSSSRQFFTSNRSSTHIPQHKSCSC